MSAESDFSPPGRLWLALENDPALPAWMEDIWIRHGRPGLDRSTPESLSGDILLWFVRYWYGARRSYQFALSPSLVQWLNTIEAGAKDRPLSRLMNSIWRERNLRTTDGAAAWQSFAADYLFTTLPAMNAPRSLIPREVISVLNRPVAGEETPVTLGMSLYLRHVRGMDVAGIGSESHERALAYSFEALTGLLGMQEPRLIPAWVSGFWCQRPFSSGSNTAYEYVAGRADDFGPAQGSDEAEFRASFHSGRAAGNPGLLLLSGPVGDQPLPIDPAVHTQDHAILVYRDHQTIAGLSKAGASMGKALAQCGLPVFDLHFSLRHDPGDVAAARNRKLWTNARRKLHLLNMNPESVGECYYCNLGRMDRQDYVVGQFFWELSGLSKIHESGIALVDEIWTASNFLTDLYGSTGKPVVTIGMSIPDTEPAPVLDRAKFGLPDDAFIFLSSFDAGSVVERKNPLGAINAFQRAFPRGNEKAALVIKTRNLDRLSTERDAAHWKESLSKIAADRRIHVLEGTFKDDELAGLYRLSDCFVSLHRSEGFGLGPAEAMLHGKPTIVTNYSGVVDFCTAESGRPVDYQMIEVKPDEYPYFDTDRRYHWADPNLATATNAMRELFEDRPLGVRLGEAGRSLILREYSVEAVRDRCLARLEQLGFGRRAAAC